MVDSGAFRTCLPVQVAHDLGIADQDLIEDPDGGTGIGSTFRFWTATGPIRGGISLFAPASDGSMTRWGFDFFLAPAFVQHDAFLLGREDCFRAFKITFADEDDGPVFYLDV